MKNTKIKLLVCLVIATLVLSLMALGSFAEGTDSVAYVASLNGKNYETLDAAIDATAELSGDAVPERNG